MAVMRTDTTKLKSDLSQVESYVSITESDMTKAKEDIRRMRADVTANEGDLNKAKAGENQSWDKLNLASNHKELDNVRWTNWNCFILKNDATLASTILHIAKL